VELVDGAQLLAAYDQQLRTAAETSSAVSVIEHGTLWFATFSGGRGFVTYRDLGFAGVNALRPLVRDVLEHYLADPEVRSIEWKTRAHDRAPGLHAALVENGFIPGEPESIMLGEARVLALDVRVPAQVALRQVTDEADVRAMTAMTDDIFGGRSSPGLQEDLIRRLATGEQLELWVAEVQGRMIGAGRLEPVPGTNFAGVWGGAVREEWRGRGIYRALTAARARSALRLGKALIHSDSTEYSRPILERSGLAKVSTTTPYTWSRT
jgi:hypothetical protein